MFKWSYSTNGLTSLTLIEAIEASEKAGYEGLELSFQFEQFDPFTLSQEELNDIKKIFDQKKIRPVAISSATTKLLSDIPHEPSLLSLDLKKRNQRIALIRRAVEIAKCLNIPIVSFQSGYLRQEHTDNPDINPRELLIEGIRTCLKDADNVTLVIEPEPGMFVETLEDATSLIDEIGSSSFRLHVDIGHAYCTEENYAQAIKEAVPYTAYMHLADIKEGYNLKIQRLLNTEQPVKEMGLDLDYAGYLLYIGLHQSVIFVDKEKCIVFSEKENEGTKNLYINWLEPLNVPIKFVPMNQVSVVALADVDLELEIKAYIESIAGIDLDLLEEMIPIIRYLRQKDIQHVVCNTLKGKVHYHEVPGKGGIDFKAVLNGLVEAQYDGYITVELYNHVDVWEDVLSSSREYLIKKVA